MVDLICNQNGESLQVLDLGSFQKHNFETFQIICNKCVNLKEMSYHHSHTNIPGMSDEECLMFWVNNMPTTLEKLAFGNCPDSLPNLDDDHIRYGNFRF